MIEFGRQVVQAVANFSRAAIFEIKKDLDAIYLAAMEMFSAKKGSSKKITFTPSQSLEKPLTHTTATSLKNEDLQLNKFERIQNKMREIDEILRGVERDSLMGLNSISGDLKIEHFAYEIRQVFDLAFQAEENIYSNRVPNKNVKRKFNKLKDAMDQFIRQYQFYLTIESTLSPKNYEVQLRQKNEELRIELNKLLKVLDKARKEESDEVRLYAMQQVHEQLAQLKKPYGIYGSMSQAVIHTDIY